MTTSRFANLLLTTLIVVLAFNAQAQEEQYYPHGALSNMFYQEQVEQKRTEDLERQAVERRDDYEKQKREVEQKIAAHKFQIEQLKTRQIQAQDDLEHVNVNLSHVRDQIAHHEAEQKRMAADTEGTLKRLADQRAELESSQKKMEKEIAELTDLRKRSEREIYSRSMEVQRMTSESAKLEAKVASAQAKRANLEAEEMKVRTEWMQTKLQLAEAQRQTENATTEMNDAKERWSQAQNELNQAKSDLARAQRNRDVTVAKVKGDVARYEQEILAASRSKIAAEAEQIRLASEAEKMKDYASRIRDTRDSAHDDQLDANGMVLRTKVAVETARTELTRNVEGADLASSLVEKEQARRRGIAAAQDAAALIDANKIFVTTNKCSAFAEPNSAGQPVSSFASGRKLLAKDHGGDWVQINNGDGKSMFIESKCGRYQN